MNLKINPSHVLKWLLVIIFVLLCANLLVAQIKLSGNMSLYYDIGQQFDFDQELNVPSVYSSLGLLLCSLLLFYIYRTSPKGNVPRLPWLVLSLLFLFLALDEISSIHETLVPILRETYGLSGIFYYSWVLPYGIVVIILGFVFIPFLIKLPKKIRSLFIISAVTFVGGALGLELFGGRHDELYGKQNISYVAYYTFEELLEMVGIAIFIYALLTYIREFTSNKNKPQKIGDSNGVNI